MSRYGSSFYRASDDKVWTPPEIKQLSRLTSTEHIWEYVTRNSGVDAGLLRNAVGVGASVRKTSQSSPPVELNLHGRKKSNRASYQKRKHSHVADNESVLDWHNTSGWTRMIDFNLELWWSRSSILTRLNVGLLALCLAIFIVNIAFAVYLIWFAATQSLKNPYLCQEKDCKKASQWITSAMNTSVDPCDNFFEFVCGNHFEKENEGNQFSSLISGPGFPVQFGENSILAKILKNFRNDPVQDQAIRYYQACLNIPKRKTFGLEAFIKMVEEVFGTRDFSKFEDTSLTMEEIGSRLFRVVGHASFINMGFYKYPFITILRPTIFSRLINFKTEDQHGYNFNNQEFSFRIMRGLMPALGVSVNSTVFEEMQGGFVWMTSLLDQAYEGVVKKPVEIKKSLDAFLNDATIQQAIGVLRAVCPPVGIKLDISEVLRLFIGEDYRLEFFDMSALKYFGFLKFCFDQTSSVSLKLTYPKTAFVTLWLVELFWEYHIQMDSKQIMNDFNLTKEELPHNRFVSVRLESTDATEEYLCLIALYRNLGYMPSIRYLLSITDNPVEFVGKIEDDITKLYEEFSGIFDRIPSSEISTVTAHLGRIQFAKRVYVDVGMPFVGGLLDNSTVADILNFTDDHLENSIIATKFTIEKARQNWIGATNAEPTIKWWGSGSPGDMRSELLDLKEPMHIPALFVEKKQAGEGKGHWEKFLRKPLPNYLLYPLTIIAQPFVSETLALRFAGITQKILRSFLSLPDHQFANDRYSSLTTRDILWFGSPESDNRTCSCLRNQDPPSPPNLHFTYTMDDTFTVYRFSRPRSGSTYNSILALKEGFKLFRQERVALMKLPFNFTLSRQEKELRLQRFLPGKRISQLSEEQLFFVAYVRQLCRGSWKTHNDYFKQRRWEMETMILNILMQTQEFAETWKCPKNSFMNNNGLPRCLQWVPT